MSEVVISDTGPLVAFLVRTVGDVQHLDPTTNNKYACQTGASPTITIASRFRLHSEDCLGGDLAKTRAGSVKLLHLIHEEFVGVGKQIETGIYKRLMRITDFICGMADSCALNLDRHISGISLPRS